MSTIPVIVDSVKDTHSRCIYFYIESGAIEKKFSSVDVIESIFDQHTEEIDVAQVWVSNSEFDRKPKRGDVYRVSKSLLTALVNTTVPAKYSALETKAYAEWSALQAKKAEENSSKLPRKSDAKRI